MKKVIFLLSLILSFALSYLYNSIKESPIDKLERLSYFVRSDTMGDSASGFVVSTGSNYNLILTAGHLLTNGITDGIYPPSKMPSIKIVQRVMSHGGQIGEKVAYCTVYKAQCDDFFDIALLKTDHKISNDSIKFYKGGIPKIGTPIYNVASGISYYYSNTFSAGYISQIGRLYLFSDIDQIQCPVYPGSSGSAVTLTNGKCIGMVEMKMLNTDNIGFIMPVRKIKAWAILNHVEDQLGF